MAKKDTPSWFSEDDDEITPVILPHPGEEGHELHHLGRISVGGGPSQAINIAIMAICLFGIIYALVTIL